jgi:diguanylate cyclase (GGDEF)-like protein/PAS domain S-box-containing protein
MNQTLAMRAFDIGSTVSNDDGPDALELYDHAASLVAMGAWSCDLESERLVWTGGVFDIFGLSREQNLERQTIVGVYGEESRELLERKRSHAIETRSGFSLDASIVRPDGTERWIRITAATRSSNGRAKTLYGMKQDITEDHVRWEALRAQAECDPLTGVANRARFQRFLEQPRDETTLDRVGALILFDMDGFKQVNDWWGHAAGDACLVAFGERLRTAFPEARLISRIGGDEFAVLLPPVSSRSATEIAVRSLIGNLLCPVPWNGALLPLGVSAGLAFASEQAELDPQALFTAADRALYNAKEDASTFLICT